ncbi:MAG: lipocalin family protein [Paludibacteraceae bacterium]|nr:lipocalin family protein [Paludibacteraceae bacterium]
MTTMISCKHSDSGNLIGTWNEYREDGDDYLLSSFTFNQDGSGFFKVQGITNTQRISFSWSLSGQRVYIKNDKGDEDILSFNNGLIIEHSAMGDIVYKKR